MKNIFLHENNLPQTAFLIGESHVINLVLYGLLNHKRGSFRKR